ncbi:MAG: hypothetical protein VX951_09765 [Planctomycetota bacterium]|nr:hypothetical protein [Planctomycetota bacterium]
MDPRCIEIERTDAEFRYRLELAEGDAYFEGHFPDQPVLPGVGQLHLLTQALSQSLGQPVHWTKAHSVRFRKPILPESPCELTVQHPDAEGEVRFQIHSEEGLMADGRFTIAATAQDQGQKMTDHV